MAVIHFSGGERLAVPGPAESVLTDLNAGKNRERFEGPNGVLPIGWVPFQAAGRHVFVNPSAVAYVTEQ
ncbi:MAG: hypothetical protein IRZ21_03285 [Thermoleophilaceae bacterium]|nr:hypothetical protein [Thermoleophilaceae bacterium]